MLPSRSSLPKALDRSSRVLVPTSSVVSPVLVSSPSTTRPNSSCSARPSRVDLVRSTCQAKAAGGLRLWAIDDGQVRNKVVVAVEVAAVAIDGGRMLQGTLEEIDTHQFSLGGLEA